MYATPNVFKRNACASSFAAGVVEVSAAGEVFEAVEVFAVAAKVETISVKGAVFPTFPRAAAPSANPPECSTAPAQKNSAAQTATGAPTRPKLRMIFDPRTREKNPAHPNVKSPTSLSAATQVVNRFYTALLH